MAKVEVNSILGSSQDNFIVFANDNYVRPMVTFYFLNNTYSSGSVVITDALNEDGYKKTIVYSPDEIITDSSFRCVANDRTGNTFSLLECLRKNSIFYDISIVSDIPNVGMVIRAYLDSSTRYDITGGQILTIGGNYSSYVPKEPNKFVLLLNDIKSQVVLEKNTIDDDISFNVTAPYEHMTFKDPVSLKMMAYHVEANNIIGETIQNNQVTVFPTTLSKFADVNLSDYLYNSVGQKVNFLTNNFNRFYNYGEVCALSVMTDNNVGILKKYYTVAGKYLGMDSTVIHQDALVKRQDLYFELDLGGIESSTNKEVGYVDVVATHNGAEITNPVRYNVVPKCNQNNVIFFVNELGGIDSFNFLGERVYKTKIKNQTTYFKNPTRKYTTVKELEIVGQKVNSVDHKLTSTILNEETARWLNEMSKSKYPFLFINENGVLFERIVITDMDIELSDRENTFEIELTYKNGDNNISV